jgi:CDP-diacylglycerol--serine O-phosphatidyltransferase
LIRAARIRPWLPTIATYGVLVAGVLSIQASLHRDFMLSAQLVLTAALLDSIDGALARHWGVTSALGAQLDSLSDLVAFGVAPAVLLVTAQLGEPPMLAAMLASGFAIAGAYRLARFNVEEKSSFFTGMPITSAGTILACLSLLPLGPNRVWLIPVVLLLALMMISKVPYYGGRAERRRFLIGQAAGLVLVWVVPDLALAVLGTMFLLYGVASPLLHALHDWEDRLASLRGASK